MRYITQYTITIQHTIYNIIPAILVCVLFGTDAILLNFTIICVVWVSMYSDNQCVNLRACMGLQLLNNNYVD